MDDKQASQHFERWRNTRPHQGATDKEKAAFLAGFLAANSPRTLTKPELLECLVANKRFEDSLEEMRRASLPPGTCPECDGAGEQGGQFSGGFWECDACKGTGKC